MNFILNSESLTSMFTKYLIKKRIFPFALLFCIGFAISFLVFQEKDLDTLQFSCNIYFMKMTLLPFLIARARYFSSRDSSKESLQKKKRKKNSSSMSNKNQKLLKLHVLHKILTCLSALLERSFGSCMWYRRILLVFSKLCYK